MPLFDLSGQITIESLEEDDQLVRYVRGQLAPCEPMLEAGDARTLDVVLAPSVEDAGAIVEEQRAADDGLTTGTDGRRLFVLSDGRRCSIPDALDAGPVRFDHDPEFPLWRIF